MFEQLSIATATDAEQIYHGKFNEVANLGWGPKLRLRFNYFTPDEYYEAQVVKLISPQTKWLDVGCGRHIFPSNQALAQQLAARAKLLFGVDPDENIKDNPLIHQHFQGALEEFFTTKTFDLITLRMVAEHIANPEAALNKLAELTHVGAVVVIYTPNLHAPMSYFARLTPLKIHHFFKKILWRTEKRDTFPVQFKMNTRKNLFKLFQHHHFKEVHFTYLDDCRTFSRFFFLNYMELLLMKGLRQLGLRYPENCLLGVYQKIAD
ncbi:class I SAM-dependent methyltransferase [Thiospirillum jenense]|uniref:Methyltransferase domain-containing protein n=1 Tax=Thiospirillum jenense TaxID=1653858 RepID=A0A839HAU3_9GAMM|nr:methyltransferase domain-containing protein [Thiospirillum jenense]MBB1125370.1 methyltransferase domain-containing protein [Thiospirillum jenense]